MAIAWEDRSTGSAACAFSLLAAWLALAAAGLPVAQWMRSGGQPEPESVELLIVQPDIPREERWTHSKQRGHISAISAYTRTALGEGTGPPDAVIWPENLSTSPVDAFPAIRRELSSRIRTLRVPVVLGVARKATSSDTSTYRSSVLWIRRDGTVGAAMDKSRAVPVVESNAWPGELLADGFGAAARWKKVEERPLGGPLEEDFTITPVLCYEALFPGIVATRRSPDSVAIVNLADDGWASGEQATQQLTAFSTFRAIEQRLTFIRVAHGGLSVVVDPFGRRLRTLPMDEYAHAWVRVGPVPAPSLGEKAAILAVPVSAGLSVCWGLRLSSRRKRSR